MSAPSYRLPPCRHPGRRRVLLGSLILALAMAAIMPATTAGAATPPATPVLHQSAELVSPPLGTYSRQGSDVALSADGSTLAVASLTWGAQGSSTVVVYVRSGDRWLTQTTLRATPTPWGYGDEYWASAIAISADGDTLAVSDPVATAIVRNRAVFDAGVVHLFTRSGHTWHAAGELVASQPQPAGWFGSDVALSGDGTKVLVGGNGNKKNAYIADAGSRVAQVLPVPAGAVSFGYSVAISPDGTSVVVGAPYGGPHPRLGEAFVLVDVPARGWVQRWHLEAQPGEEGSSFGAAVAVTDTGTVVVGAPSSHRGVSVFDRRGAALVRTARFTPQYDRQAYGLGGSVSVSADGSTVVAGASSRDAAGRSVTGAGAGYRWVRSRGGWSWAGLLSVAHPNTYEAQGSSTAVSGDGRVVVLGAPGRTSARRGVTGAAIVFSAVS